MCSMSLNHIYTFSSLKINIFRFYSILSRLQNDKNLQVRRKTAHIANYVTKLEPFFVLTVVVLSRGPDTLLHTSVS